MNFIKGHTYLYDDLSPKIDYSIVTFDSEEKHKYHFILNWTENEGSKKYIGKMTTWYKSAMTGPSFTDHLYEIGSLSERQQRGVIEAILA